jgi:trk system potassium uptake protein TrkH
VFQSVSAFCNAGFSTFSDSLTRFGGSWPTQLVIMALIVVGGLGFLPLEEIRILRKQRRTGWAAGLSLHSRLVLTTTAALLVGGWGLYLLLEWGNTLAVFAPAERLLNAMFMSVTARTAGFNTVDYGATADSTNFVTMLLMSVGGSPGSTAGGLKTTTFALIGLLAVARLRGSLVVGAWDRSIPAETVQRAVGLFVLAFGTVTLGILLISIMEIGGTRHGGAPGIFIGQMFEMVSAFNTVGLSMGATSDLSGGGRGLTILLMFMGRVGPLTVVMALARPGMNGERGFRYSYEDVMIG